MRAHRTRVVVLAVAGLAASAIGCGDDRPAFPDAGAVAPNAAFPPTLALGAAGCGVARSESFTVQNTGTGNLNYAISSSNAALTVTPSSGTIIAGTSTTFMASFTVPASTAAGSNVTATLTVTTNATAKPTTTVEVSAVATGAQIAVDGDIAFGEIVRGGVDGSHAYKLRNTGNAPATVTLSKPAVAPFTLTWSGAPGPTEIAAGGALDATATFHPATLGAASGTATYAVAGVQCGTPAGGDIKLSGSGVRSGQVRVVGGAEFGTVACGSEPDSRSLMIINDGAVAATWTAALVNLDAAADQYDLSRDSDTPLAPDDMATLTVKRRTLGTTEVPFVPGPVTATLRVTTTVQGGAPVIHDIAVNQLLTGAYLEELPERPPVNFGFRTPATTTRLPVRVRNRGNADGAPTVEGLESPLGAELPGDIKAGNLGLVNFTYEAPGEQGRLTQTAQISAANDCRGPIAVGIAAGSGPLATFGNITLEGECRSVEGKPQIQIRNSGNQDLVISSCAVIKDPDGVVPVFPRELPAAIPPEGVAFMQIDFALRGHDGTADLQCQVNEPAQPTREFTFKRALTGADLELSAEGSLKFTCEEAQRLVAIRIHNAGNATVPVQPRLDPLVATPLGFNGELGDLAPGEDLPGVGVFTSGTGSGSGELCSGSGSGGTQVVFNGVVTVDTVVNDRTVNICSITPSDGLQVTMTRAPVPVHVAR